MDYTKKVIYQSNYWYNDGLAKANIRDLSGALNSLRRSLQFNRDNIAARNLLGLVYYGRGEIVEALVEWVLSKNIQREDNIAGYFIKQIQQDTAKLRLTNQAIKKYNISIEYAKQDAEDMALIQLNQAIKEHPDFVKAHQLLALLYMNAGDLKKATKHVRIARALDKTDEITLRYAHELDEIKKEQERPNPMAKLGKNKNGTISYKVGNDTIIQPAPATFKDGNGRYTVLNIVIGVALGVAVMMFLIMPATLSGKQAALNKEMLSFSDRIAVQEAQISALKKELEKYQASEEPVAKEAAETGDDVRNYYETIDTVYTHWQNSDMSDADLLTELLKIKPDSLGTSARAKYDEVSADVFSRQLPKISEQAKSSYDSGNFEEAIGLLTQVVGMDKSYEDAMYYYMLGKAYESANNKDQAKAIYQDLVKNYAESAGGKEAATSLEGLKE
ncbi:MAG TPA: tetratricopeptide repeat protein [Candidatus Dorea intestinavium]|nr:tetratricopeptide repeat protein [Candidatus Dorea intestinavium]